MVLYLDKQISTDNTHLTDYLIDWLFDCVFDTRRPHKNPHPRLPSTQIVALHSMLALTEPTKHYQTFFCISDQYTPLKYGNEYAISSYTYWAYDYISMLGLKLIMLVKGALPAMMKHQEMKT